MIIWANNILERLGAYEKHECADARTKRGQSFAAGLVSTNWPRLIRGWPGILVVPIWAYTGIIPVTDVTG